MPVSLSSDLPRTDVKTEVFCFLVPNEKISYFMKILQNLQCGEIFLIKFVCFLMDVSEEIKLD